MLSAQQNAHNQDTAFQKSADGIILLRQIDSLQKAAVMNMQMLQAELNTLKEGSSNKSKLTQKLKDQQYKDSITLIKNRLRIDSLKKKTKAWPVKLINDTLFVIYAKLGPLTPLERARKTEEKIRKIADEANYITDSLYVDTNDLTIDIHYKNTILLSISKADALWAGKTPEVYALELRSAINKSITKYIEDHSLTKSLTRIGLSMAVIILLSVLIWLVYRLFAYLRRFVELKKGNWFRGTSINNYQLVHEDRQIELIAGFLKLLRLFTIILLIYIALPVIFSFFPWTEELAKRLIGYILRPVKNIGNGILGFLPNLITITIIIIITRYLIKLVNYFAKEIYDKNLVIKGFYHDWAQPTANITRFLLYAFMFVMIFPYLPGSESTVFKGVSVFIGVLFSLGSSSAISNAIAGFVITYMRPFKTGDRVKIGEITGEIMEKTLLVTRIKSLKNEVITVPNSSILNSSTINYSTSAQEFGLIIHTTVTIGYDAPWRTVHQLLFDAALKTPGILKDPQPFVLQTSLDDFYVSYQINAYLHDPKNMPAAYSALHANIQDSFNTSGVEIMSPHYRSARDGNQTTIPEDYLPKDYDAPGFRVKQL